jgi:hypothetical protein
MGRAECRIAGTMNVRCQFGYWRSFFTPLTWALPGS